MTGGKGGGLGGRGNKAGSHRKGAQKGSGGKNRRSLEGRGPTPPKEMRPAHPASRRAGAVGRAAAAKQRVGGAARTKPDGQSPRARRDLPEMVAGRNAVWEALQAEVPAMRLVVRQFIDADDRVKESISLAVNRGLPLAETSATELDRLTGGAFHQGIALQVRPYEYAHPDDLLAAADDAAQPALVVALDGVTDPRNLGAVVRSAAAFGAHGVVVPERRAAGMTAGAWKASAGAAARLPVARATNLTRTLQAYKKAGLYVVGLSLDGEADVEELAETSDPLVIVVGSEGRGLSRLVAENCDTRVRIPMGGPVESLNAGVAAGIVLYEVSRGRR